jgi:RNA polymerase sigma factor (sigma-70 family)
MNPSFHDCFVELFRAHFQRLYRYLDRLSGDSDLAADLAQDTFVRLYRRGSAPDRPEAWLITVATNLFRNVRSTGTRRARLLRSRPDGDLVADPAVPTPVLLEQEDSRQRVRAALERLSERERRLLLLRAEGYSYRDLAEALELKEASVGTLLARAKQAFLQHYEAESDAPRG